MGNKGKKELAIPARVILNCGSCGDAVKFYDKPVNGKVPEEDRLERCGCGAYLSYDDIEDSIRDNYLAWRKGGCDKNNARIPIHILVRAGPWSKEEKRQ